MRRAIPTMFFLLQASCALDVPPLVARDARAERASPSPLPDPGATPCPKGQARCDDRCVSLASDPEHCGRCGHACGTGACLAGTCIPSDPCTEGSTRCDGRCVDTQTDPLHCGACGRHCARLPGTDGSCSMGRCRCAQGYADCDGDPTNGCEARTDNDPAHCGACGARCDPAHGVLTCEAGRCVLRRCDPAWGDCDGDARNGCETPLTSTAHCGACGVACPGPAHASAACAVGPSMRCSFVCETGYADCDGDPTNGCEADLTRSFRHCGRCNAPCNGNCVAGVCR